MTYDNLIDQQVLAKTIWGEARGDNMTAVACVIANRADNPSWWGTDIRSVCLKPEQFDCWNPDDPNLPKLLAVDESNQQYAKAMDIALQAVNGSLQDITNGATYYYAKSMTEPPYWAKGKTPCFETTQQLFFNNIN